MFLGRFQDWSAEGLHQPTGRGRERRHATVRMRERTKTRTVLWYALVLVLVLEGIVLIAMLVRDDGTTGSTDGGSGAIEVWRLDPVPLMTVGDTEADPLYEVAGIVITDSHVVIAQESTGTLRFHTHAGALDTVVGGRGEGPGEFGDLQWMKRAGDHLFAYDSYGHRVSRFSLDGGLESSISLVRPEEYPGLWALDVFSDGSVLGYAYDLYMPTEPAVKRLPRTLILSDSEGAFVGRLFDMTGPETWYEPVGVAGRRQMFRLYGRATQAVAVDSLLAVLENDSYDIPVYGRDGVVRDTLRPAVVPGPTPLPRHRADFIQQALLDSWDLGDTRGEVEGLLDAMGTPEHLPPYGWLSLGYPNRPPITAADGVVWALRYGGIPREDADPDGPEWFVFQPGVGQIATLSSPDDVILYDVAGDLAAVLRRTELDEEVVELRRIVGR